MIRRQGLYDLFVIGGGVAGLSAAAFAAHHGSHVGLAEGRGIYGGLIANIGHVDGIFLPSKPSGLTIATDLLQSCATGGVSILDAEIASISPGSPVKVTTADKKQYRARAVIIASGGSLRKLNVPGERELAGRGISQCATCDGQFFKSGDVVVVGGGDAALQEALVLSDICRKVTIVSRSRLRASRAHIERVSSRPNVEFVWNARVEAIEGNDKVTGVLLCDLATGAVSNRACAGVFPFIGVEPNAEFISSELKSSTGHIRTTDTLETAEKRIFAAGCVREGYGGQITQAAAEGIKAAQGASLYSNA